MECGNRGVGVGQENGKDSGIHQSQTTLQAQLPLFHSLPSLRKWVSKTWLFLLDALVNSVGVGRSGGEAEDGDKVKRCSNSRVLDNMLPALYRALFLAREVFRPPQAQLFRDSFHNASVRSKCTPSCHL